MNSLTNNYLELLLNSALPTSGTSALTNNLSTSVASLTLGTSDASQLSPFAQVLSTLQQLQESNPTEYAQVTKQIATNLQTAAQTDTSQGNTSGASELTQLATDFTTVSTTGQLPNIADLAQAIGGPPSPPPGGFGPPPADSSSTSGSSSTSSSSSAVQQLEQLLASLANNTNATSSISPMAIILQTLSNAGISSSSAS